MENNDPLEINYLIQHILKIVEKEKESIQISQIKENTDLSNNKDLLILKYFKTKDNIEIKNMQNKTLSFMYSVMYCLNQSFINLQYNDQILYIEKCINKFCSILEKRNSINKYTTGTYMCNKKTLITNFIDKKFTESQIAFIALYFNINIFVIKTIYNQDNSTENKIILYNSNQHFNKFKHSIILFYDNKNANSINDIYDPIIINNKTIFTYDNKIFNDFIINNQTNIKVYSQNTYFSGFNNINITYDYDIETIWENEYNQINKKNIKPKNITNSENIESLLEKQQVQQNKKEETVFEKCEDKNSDKGNDKSSDKNTKTPNDFETTEQMINVIMNSELLYSEKDLKKNKISELKELMKKHNISLTCTKDNKIKQKLKEEMIIDLLKVTK